MFTIGSFGISRNGFLTLKPLQLPRSFLSLDIGHTSAPTSMYSKYKHEFLITSSEKELEFSITDRVII